MKDLFLDLAFRLAQTTSVNGYAYEYDHRLWFVTPLS